MDSRKKCTSCFVYLHKDNGKQLEIRSEVVAVEVSEWLSGLPPEVGKIVVIQASVGDKLCSRCFSKLRLYRSNKLKLQPEVECPDAQQQERTPGPDPEQEDKAERLDTQQQMETERFDVQEQMETEEPNAQLQMQAEESDGVSTEYSSPSQPVDDSDLSVVFVEKPAVEMVELPIKRTIATHRICFLCRGIENLVQVSFAARFYVFSRTQIFIPKGTKKV